MAPFLPCHEKTFSTTQFCRTCSCCYRRAAPDAKTSLAYTTGPFSAPHCPARPSRTTEGQILYGKRLPGGALFVRMSRTQPLVGQALTAACEGDGPAVAESVLDDKVPHYEVVLVSVDADIAAA